MSEQIITNDTMCHSCNTEYKDSLAKFSIKKTGKCPVCYKAYMELPENDPDNKRFVVAFENHSEDSTIIYAKTEQEAREEFEYHWGGEFTTYDISEVKK